MSEAGIGKHPVFDGITFGVGAWSWGDRLFWGYGRDYQESDLKAVFDTCLQAGMTFFDTAEVYGQGRSESLIGKFLSETSTPVKIATKFMPYPWRLSRHALQRALKASLKRLGRTQVDLYQIHWPLPPLTVETWMASMVEAYQNNLIAAIGVSNYDRGQTQRAYDSLIHEGISLASNQVEYHLLNRQIEKNGLLKYCQDLGITVIAYSPLAQGVLTGKYTPDNLPQGVRGGRYNRKMITRVQPLIVELKRIGAEHAGKTAGQVALNWVISKGAIPIPGAKNVLQLEQNLGAMGWQLTEDEVARLDDLSDRVAEE